MDQLNLWWIKDCCHAIDNKSPFQVPMFRRAHARSPQFWSGCLSCFVLWVAVPWPNQGTGCRVLGSVMHKSSIVERRVMMCSACVWAVTHIQRKTCFFWCIRIQLKILSDKLSNCPGKASKKKLSFCLVLRAALVAVAMLWTACQSELCLPRCKRVCEFRQLALWALSQTSNSTAWLRTQTRIKAGVLGLTLAGWTLKNSIFGYIWHGH